MPTTIADMKVLHTADWHLNDRLGRIDRTDDLRTAVEKVAAHCREQAVDVLLVAGDLFSELARPDALRETIHHWQDVFTGFLRGGGTILAITGNHDNENFCKTLQHAMTLAAPTTGEPGQVVQPGRLYLAAEPTFLKLRSKADDFAVQFVLMPFPTPSRYLKQAAGETAVKYATAAEKNRKLTNAFERVHGELRKHPAFDPAMPAILGAHITMHGSTVGPSLFRLQESEDIVVSGEAWHEQYAYVALGHIHKPQFVMHPYVRYSGTIERLDLGESNNQPGVVLVEFNAEGRATEPAILPVGGTPIYEVTLLNPKDDLPRLKEEYPDADEDLVNLHIHYTAGEDNLEAILHELGRIFPRWYARDWTETGRLRESLSLGEADRGKSFRKTVIDYVTQELLQHDPAQQAELLAVVEGLIDGEE